MTSIGKVLDCCRKIIIIRGEAINGRMIPAVVLIK